mmetsp:Transcript_14101/g.22026  ORF Transcript_14101/g.22026 Transcript_14101/m.22026 type:complete len:246 (-) Transcript_14101:145-882(-)
MGRKGKKQTKGKTNIVTNQQSGKNGWLWVDPARVRFQHARIRQYFSGCGRSVIETLESIRRGDLSPGDLPPIQVIVGPEDSGGVWYFSLNNRRLYVLKRCREEGLLDNNLVRVRVRQAKSENEMERYTLENCALEAKFIRERDPKGEAAIEHESEKNSCERITECDKKSKAEAEENSTFSKEIREHVVESGTNGITNYFIPPENQGGYESTSDSGSDSHTSNCGFKHTNPFDMNESGTDTDSDGN